MKQKHADSPSAFLAAAMAVTGAAMLLCPLIGQNTEMNRSAAEYDDLRVQLKSEEPAQATDAPENRSTLRQMFDAVGFPSATQETLELPKPDESPPEINIGTGADLAACLAQNDDFIAWIRIPGHERGLSRRLDGRRRVLPASHVEREAGRGGNAVFADENGLQHPQPQYRHLRASSQIHRREDVHVALAV